MFYTSIIIFLFLKNCVKKLKSTNNMTSFNLFFSFIILKNEYFFSGFPELCVNYVDFYLAPWQRFGYEWKHQAADPGWACLDPDIRPFRNTESEMDPESFTSPYFCSLHFYWYCSHFEAFRISLLYFYSVQQALQKFRSKSGFFAW